MATFKYKVQSSKRKESIKNESEDEEDNDKNQKIAGENNHVYFHAEVNRGTIFQLIECLQQAEETCILMKHRLSLEEIPLYLHINSFGGSVFDAMTAIDFIKSCKVPVYTIIEGATASAGTLMSVVGKKRFIRPFAYMLIHQLSSGFWGKMNELEDDFKNSQILMDRIKSIYKEHTNVPKKKLAEILKHDLWWDSDECLEYGLVDGLWE